MFFAKERLLRDEILLRTILYLVEDFKGGVAERASGTGLVGLPAFRRCSRQHFEQCHCHSGLP